MATARKLKSGSWRCLIYDGNDSNGKRVYKSFTASTKKQAEYEATVYVLNKKDIKNKDKISFKDAMNNYILSREAVLSPASIREYKRAQNKDFNDLNDLFINEITQDIIQHHINNFSKNHSPKSVRNNHGLISSVLKKYRPEFKLNTILPQKKRPELYIPSENDIKKIMEISKGTDMEIPILLAAFGPMRRGEICALESDQVHGNRVHVCKNMVLNSNRQFIIKQPKSYAGDRFIDYPDFVGKKLAGIKGRITNLNPNMITSRFDHILKNAGVTHFRFHDLRHYGASILHALGIPDAYIMERGGWGNDAVLKNVYRHVIDEKSKEMTSKANDYFESMQHEMQHKK